MRAVIQRVLSGKVHVNKAQIAKIHDGLLILLGIDEFDTIEDLKYLVDKVIKMRILSDHNNKMNISIEESQKELLIISQFTLFASTKKGNRPSYMRSAHPSKAKEMYERFIFECSERLPGKVQSGEFGAHMEVELINNGPVTIILDSKNKNY